MGNKLEKKLSLSLHLSNNSIPLLISPIILRKRNCGQVDLAVIKRSKKGLLGFIFEVKRGQRVSFEQKRRLENSLILLQGLISCPIELIYAMSNGRIQVSSQKDFS